MLRLFNEGFEKVVRHIKGDLVKGASIYLIANIVSASIPFLMLPILTRLLSTAEYGRVGVFQSLMSIFAVLVGMGGHESARARYYKSSKNEYKEVLASIVLVLMCSVLIVGLISGIYKNQLTSILKINEEILYLAIIGAFGQFLITFRLAVWQVKNKPARYGLLRIVITLTNVTGSLFLVWYLSMGAEGRMYGIVVPVLFFGICSLLLMYSCEEIKGVLGSKRYLSMVLNYSVPLLPHALVGVIVVSFDRIVLQSQHGEEVVGMYFVALQLSMPIFIFSTSFNLAFKPWSYEKMANGENDKVVVGSYYAMVLLAGVTIIYLILLYYTYHYLVGDAFSGGRFLCMILVVSAMFSGFYLIVVKGIFYSEKTVILTIVTVPIGLFYCCVIYNIAGIYGAKGVAVTNLCYAFILFLLVWYVSNRIYPQPWFDIKALIGRD